MSCRSAEVEPLLAATLAPMPVLHGCGAASPAAARPPTGSDAPCERTSFQVEPGGRAPARRTDDPSPECPALERPRTPCARDDAGPAPSPRHAAAATSADRPALRPRRRLDSGELLAGATEIEIEHGSAVYRLRLTSLGKLILTK